MRPASSSAHIRTIGIIGAGQMGNGIAQTAASGGFQVLMLDVDRTALARGMAAIDASLERLRARGKISAEEKMRTMARITTGTDYSMLADADLVIEAASEDEETKRSIFNSLCPTLKPEAIVASNTSSLSITRLGASTDRPERFMGMHFMNPVPIMALVELIRGIATGEETFAAIRDLVGRLGKSPVEAGDYPAFIVNRVLLPMINEAIYTLFEGVGTVEHIDAAMKLGANHPMGPLELADFIGLDTCLAIMQVLHVGMGDSKYRPCPLLVKYVEAGWLGRKSGRGFYDYSGDKPVPTR
ncbi:MAG: 3-hydroxybutyryl-CoA dehydrogenase [Telmatospirillum sp.]|nr:3-hydroxybutyryl-CoA dehydrogenase [Telmatospirillum sp.]